jgi:transcriptional regulator with XRE-family HTH domain
VPEKETTGSTVPRRQLGRHLRELRSRQRITVRAAAEKLEWSEAKMWRIETGQTSMRSLDVETMCRIYGAPPQLTVALMALARETKARGWWHAYGDAIPDYFDIYIGLEEAASQLSWYEAELVPGLLQTEDYARTLIRAGNPSMDQDRVERRVQGRIARRALLTRSIAPPQIDVALSEAILCRPVGGSQIMAAQLRRLLEAGDLPNVSLRVIPFSTGLHHGVMSGPFVILRFPPDGDGKDTEPPTVYVEGFTGALYLEKPGEVERYTTAFASIWGSALGELASKSLIHNAIKEI